MATSTRRGQSRLSGVPGGGAAQLPFIATLREDTRPCEVVMQQPAYLQQGGEDAEVCSETLQIESKIFFCDAKTNTRGLYLKISEKKANRERSTIIIPGRSLPWFRELFNYYATTDPAVVTSKEYPVDSKVFFWSLGANPWGRYLRISENGAGPKGRCHIMVPAGGASAEGWLAFRDVLARIEAYTSRSMPAQVDLERLVAEVSLGSSPSMGAGMGGSSPGVAGRGSMTSMGSAPTPRNLMTANAFASAQGLQNRNLSDLGSYLELLSLSTGHEQEPGPESHLQEHSLQPQRAVQAPNSQRLAPSAPPSQPPSHSQLQYQLSAPLQPSAHAKQTMQIPQPMPLPFRSMGEPPLSQMSMPMPGQALLGSLPTELSCTEGGGVLLRAGLKRFFFDTFQNPNGSFFRITEVYGHERVAITVPESAARHFDEALRLCLGQLPGQTARPGGGKPREGPAERTL